MLVGAILHDTVEDTDTSLEEVEAEFGEEVRRIVAEVSDDKNLEKMERKRLQIVRAPHKSPKVLSINVTNNLGTLHYFSSLRVGSFMNTLVIARSKSSAGFDPQDGCICDS